uniref:Joining chain of multimeric IgA and IgM n=1 Tax=Dromaius novaehollandiae TaxID=8790 RepID=A0A8C4P6Q2_DRONO
MKSSLLLWVALAVSLGFTLVAGYPRAYEDEEYVLRNIYITVPLLSRENISDPTSPLRTTFVYRMSELCKKCDPAEVELDGEIYKAQQSSSCDAEETCYTYNRDKCYTTTFPFFYRGETKMVQAALTPASCYADEIPAPRVMQAHLYLFLSIKRQLFRKSSCRLSEMLFLHSWHIFATSFCISNTITL